MRCPPPVGVFSLVQAIHLHKQVRGTRLGRSALVAFTAGRQACKAISRALPAGICSLNCCSGRWSFSARTVRQADCGSLAARHRGRQPARRRPPAADRLHRERGGVMVDADAHPAGVGRQVIDPGHAPAPGPQLPSAAAAAAHPGATRSTRTSPRNLDLAHTTSGVPDSGKLRVISLQALTGIGP